jgi:uncharacterized protein YraI
MNRSGTNRRFSILRYRSQPVPALRFGKLILAVAGALLFAAAYAASEVGTTRMDVKLLSAPKTDAKTVGQLGADTRVDIAERRGAWMRVKADGTAGWVRLHQVRLGTGAEKTSSEGMKMLWTAGQTGRSGATGIVATTGVRGLSAEDLKTANPNPQQVQALEKYRASDQQAREQARAAGLRERQIAPLPKEEQS